MPLLVLKKGIRHYALGSTFTVNRLLNITNRIRDIYDTFRQQCCTTWKYILLDQFPRYSSSSVVIHTFTSLLLKSKLFLQVKDRAIPRFPSALITACIHFLPLYLFTRLKLATNSESKPFYPNKELFSLTREISVSFSNNRALVQFLLNLSQNSQFFPSF